jgi:hypothetical protein
MPFVIRRNDDESWEAACRRLAAAQGLEDEVMAIFAEEIAVGVEPGLACFNALYEWDCVDFLEE